jgi:hypothetical protein
LTKRHTKQSHKQKNGQFFTTKADHILSGFEDVVRNKVVIDPFVGGKDLLIWAEKNGAVDTIGYDLEPTSDDIIKNDSIANPPSYNGMVLVTNPPYLSKNKFRGDKTVFDTWKQSDLYKCHLASLEARDCQEAIIILPSNFLCESSPRARKMLFESYHIVSAKYWNEPVFEDAATGICVIHIKKGKKQYQDFVLSHETDNVSISIRLEERYNYLHGKDFFDHIRRASGDLEAIKTDIGMKTPNTNIVVGLLDNGKWKSGLSYNEGDVIFSRPKSFTTYQLTLPSITLTEQQQREVIRVFNNTLHHYRKKYHDMFLSNYMGPRQKILSLSFINKLLEVSLKDLGFMKKETTLEKFL